MKNDMELAIQKMWTMHVQTLTQLVSGCHFNTEIEEICIKILEKHTKM
jgi:hypothetical protein